MFVVIYYTCFSQQIGTLSKSELNNIFFHSYSRCVKNRFTCVFHKSNYNNLLEFRTKLY